MKKSLLIVLAIVFVCGAMAAYAVTTDTPTATDITATGAENILTYKNTGNVAQTPLAGSDITTTVMPMYGFGGLNAPADQTTTPDVPVSYLYVITNEGNDTDTYALSLGSFSYSGGASAWTSAILASDGTTEISSIQLTEDAGGSFLVKVTPNTASAPNASYADITVTASTGATPVGIYTGANGSTYGGIATDSDTTRTTISAAVMEMTRTATVDAPTAYTGGVHDPVPGAIITYTISYSNTGAGNAVDAVIIDKVPATYTTGKYSMKVGAVANATITASAPTATGWTAEDSTDGSTYTAVVSNTLQAGATHVRWTKATVAPAESGTLVWSVIIK